MSQHATLEIKLDNFKHNYQEIKKLLKEDVSIMPIFKDNAYKTYINTQINLLNELNINIIGIAKSSEGKAMRELGFKEEILLLNQPLSDDISEIAQYNLTIGCGSIEFIQRLKNFPANFNIHIEVCTGMGRTGIQPNEIKGYIDEIKKSSNITVTGIYTHFSCSECDIEYTQQQIELFQSAVKIAQKEIPTLRYIHACNSAGILNFPDAHFNLIRPGLLLYGHYPNQELKEKITLKPITTLKAKISFLKEVPKNTPISYGKTFITQRPSKIATVTLGYADGIPRMLSNKGNVIINNQIAPIVGKICMDCFMIDVTEIDAKINDDVYLWDNQNITVEDIANLCDTISYEILTGISENVKRKFI